MEWDARFYQISLEHSSKGDNEATESREGAVAYSRIHEHRSVLNVLCASAHFHLPSCMTINNSVISISVSMGIACSRHCPERLSG